MTKSTTNVPQFSSRYELRERLGAGGMGVVYVGFDNVLNKDVAVKLLLPSLKSETVVRFHKEAKAAAKVDHVNILKVLDFGQSEKGDLYLVMDYIDGVSLEDLVKESGPLEVKTAVDVFCQICDGLQHAHNHDVLHRDIKPSNIMLARQSDGSYLVKIVDFGLAKLESDDQKLTTTGVRVGSPMYMSPEQARAEVVDQRSDIYSLGCLMFTTLTGEPPLKGERYMETIAKQIDEIAPKLNDLAETARFPEALESIVEKALCKDPDERFQSADELKQALLNMKEEVAFAKPVLPNGQRSSKNWMAVSSVALGALALICIMGWALNSFWASKSDQLDLSYHDIEAHSWLVASGKVHGDGIRQLKNYTKHELDIRLILDDPKVSDSDLSYLADLPVAALDLSGTRVTEKGLVTIAGFPFLRSLILNYDKNIDNGAIDYLVRNPNLAIIGLRATSIDDEAVEKLAKMEKLISLDLSETKAISKSSLTYLERAPNLVALRIGGTSIRGSDLGILAGLQKLKCLSLANLSLEDADLKAFARSNFGALDLSNNREISDDGLRRLGGDDLLFLNVTGCPKVTRAFLSELKAKQSNLQVFSDFNPYNSNKEEKMPPDKWRSDPGRAYYDPVCMQVWGAHKHLPHLKDILK